MKKFIIIIIYLVIIIYLIKINNYRFDHFVDPIDYKKVDIYNEKYNKIRNRDHPAGYKNIILFVIDGARKEYLYNKEISKYIVKRWEKRGIRFANVTTMLPSVSAPNYFSILSGAPVYIHGVTNNSRRFPRHQKTDSIFDHLNHNGLTSAIIGFNWYKDLFKDKTKYMPAECCEKDDAGEALEILNDLITSHSLPSFTVVHFLGPDNSAHATHSNQSDKYRQSIIEIDKLLENSFEVLHKNYPDSLVIVMSDHGMNIDGNHGGSDEETLKVPLYFFAGNIPSQEIEREIYNISVIPTVSALFGIPIPNYSSGSLIYEIIDKKRIIDYMHESIDKKEMIIEHLEGVGSRGFVMSDNLMESLVKHDNGLTDKILAYQKKYNNNILKHQRIIAAILFLIFFLWAFYRTGRCISVILIINTIIVLAMGFVACYFIISRNTYDISVAFYIVVLFAAHICYKYIFTDFSILTYLNPVRYFFYILSLLLILNIIISGFFVPFHTLSADENIFAFRFFSISYIHPFLFMSMLLFRDWVKGRVNKKDNALSL